MSLRIAPSPFKSDKEVVTAAVRSNSHVFKFVGKSMRDDKDVLLAFVENCDLNLLKQFPREQ